MAAELRGRRFRLEQLDGVALETWRRILLAQPARTPFLGPTFAAAVAAVRARVLVCVLEQDGTQIGFFPFQFNSRLHALLGIGERPAEFMSDYAGLAAQSPTLLAPTDLLRLAGLQAYRFSHLDESQA